MHTEQDNLQSKNLFVSALWLTVLPTFFSPSLAFLLLISQQINDGSNKTIIIIIIIMMMVHHDWISTCATVLLSHLEYRKKLALYQKFHKNRELFQCCLFTTAKPFFQSVMYHTEITATLKIHRDLNTQNESGSSHMYSTCTLFLFYHQNNLKTM